MTNGKKRQTTHESQTAALLAFNATASVALAKTPSDNAKKYGLCAAANAAMMMHLVLNPGPPTTLPTIRAGNTIQVNESHQSVLDFEFFCTCSEELSQVLPTRPDLAKRRTPMLMARVANPLVSSKARLATAAARTLTRGQKR